MAVTQNDLRGFQIFAVAKLNGGGAESLVELAGPWEAQRQLETTPEMEDTFADIRESRADIEAGRVSPVADAFADVRQQLGLG